MRWRRAGPGRRGRALLVCLALVTPAAAAHAGGPSARCQARRAGDRVLAAIELQQMLDAEMLRLLQLGMKGRLRVETSVVRRRFGLFEQQAGSATDELVLAAGPEGHGLLVGNRLQDDPKAKVSLERVAVRLPEDERPDQSLTFRVTVRLRVVTVASLSKVAAWVTDSSEEDASSSLVTRALLSAVANDLTRSVETSCAVAPSP
jgi:hypothetical protein